MALNDKKMLPQFVLEIDLIKDILQSCNQEFELLQRYITSVKNELNIALADKMLERYERIFQVRVEAKDSRRERVDKLLSKLNMNGTCKRIDILEVIELITKRGGDVVEHFEDYSFDVIVNLLLDDTTSTLQNLKTEIAVMRPAHLLFSVIALIEVIKFVHKYEVTLEQVDVVMKNNSFGAINHYLNGDHILDGSYNLVQNFRKKLPFSNCLFEVKSKNTLKCSCVLFADTFWNLNSEYALDGYKKLNAERIGVKL